MSEQHPAASNPRCVCAEINTRHCPAHGQGESAARRVWRLPLYFGFGGVVITIEPWSWRGIRRRLR